MQLLVRLVENVQTNPPNEHRRARYDLQRATRDEDKIGAFALLASFAVWLITACETN